MRRQKWRVSFFVVVVAVVVVVVVVFVVVVVVVATSTNAPSEMEGKFLSSPFLIT